MILIRKQSPIFISIDDDCHDNSDEQNCPGKKTRDFSIFLSLMISWNTDMSNKSISMSKYGYLYQ